MDELAIYCDTSVFSGHEIMLTRMIEGLMESTPGAVVLLIFSRNNSELMQFAECMTMRYKSVTSKTLSFDAEKINRRPWDFLHAVREILMILRSRNSRKILIAQGDITSAKAGLLASKLLRIHTVSYIPLVDDVSPTEGNLRSLFKSFLRKKLYYLPSEFITLSTFLRKRILKLRPSVAVRVLENYIDCCNLASSDELDRMAARGRLGVSTSKKFVVSQIGRINYPQKRQNFLVETVRANQDKFEDFIFLFVGDGPDRKVLEKTIDEDKFLQSHMLSLGHCSDVWQILRASDLVVLPSAYEGVPLVLLESIFADRPVLAGNVSGLSEYLPSELLFDPDNSIEFANKIRSCVKMDVTEIKQSFKGRFSRSVFVEQVKNLLVC
ncbi:glycosyltransferase [Paraburkholderia sediminicola]|uniref:glycosyltransferase n=1 Tax=Paraburkholderia sediminicola TaxID=458836 RepID=UPI0038B7F6DF